MAKKHEKYQTASRMEIEIDLDGMKKRLSMNYYFNPMNLYVKNSQTDFVIYQFVKGSLVTNNQGRG